VAAAQARLAETSGRLEVTQEARTELQRRIAALALDEQRLQAELARAEEQTSWLAQVAQYHQGYGEQSTAHQVEITADNREELLAWLSGQLGEQITVPDLEGMDFIGGRLLFANGEPIGQIAYHDEADRLFGYCLTENDTGEVAAPQRSSFGSLNMVSWSDATTSYVLVGWQPPERIETLVRQLRDS
jgi:anti-sigma factor RsiW